MLFRSSDGHLAIHAEVIGHIADASADLCGFIFDVAAENLYFATIWLQQSTNHPHGSCFTGTIGADKGMQRLGQDTKRNVTEGLVPAKGMRQLIDEDGGNCIASNRWHNGVLFL